jgi:hypothetical protein
MAGLPRRETGGLGHLGPAQVFLAFETPKVGGSYGQRAVVQESGHVLDRLPSVSPELGGGVAKDV